MPSIGYFRGLKHPAFIRNVMNPRHGLGGGGVNFTESTPASQPVVPSVGANSAQTD